MNERERETMTFKALRKYGLLSDDIMQIYSSITLSNNSDVCIINMAGVVRLYAAAVQGLGMVLSNIIHDNTYNKRRFLWRRNMAIQYKGAGHKQDNFGNNAS